MTYATEHIANTLKAARKSKGLSQRELSAKSGVPQGHISKIENGAVDLRVSSLIALARVLDVEMTLVPRKAVPAVKSIARSSTINAWLDNNVAHQIRNKLAQLQNAISHLPTDLLPKAEIEKFQNQARALQYYQLSQFETEAIQKAHRATKEFIKHRKNMEELQQAFSQLQELRNTLTHEMVKAPEIDYVRPAYSLDDEEHG